MTRIEKAQEVDRYIAEQNQPKNQWAYQDDKPIQIVQTQEKQTLVACDKKRCACSVRYLHRCVVPPLADCAPGVCSIRYKAAGQPDRAAGATASQTTINDTNTRPVLGRLKHDRPSDLVNDFPRMPLALGAPFSIPRLVTTWERLCIPFLTHNKPICEKKSKCIPMNILEWPRRYNRKQKKKKKRKISCQRY